MQQMKDLMIHPQIAEEDLDENQSLHQQIQDAYQMSLSFNEIQQLPPLPKTFTLLSWCRQVLPRLATARDIRANDPDMFEYFQSVVALCELLISRLTLQEKQRIEDENRNHVSLHMKRVTQGLFQIVSAGARETITFTGGVGFSDLE